MPLKFKGLAGRAPLIHFHPFMAAELGPDFSFDAALRNGLIPLIVTANAPGKTLETYITLYGAFARFLEAISFSHGSILNLSNIAIECQVSRKIVENYLSIIDGIPCWPVEGFLLQLKPNYWP